MSQVIMFTRVGDEEVHIGKCTHAQARILEKKQHGRIENGKLFLNVRPVHLAVAEAWLEHSPSDPNVSKAELQRRMEWLKKLMGHVATAEADYRGRTKEEWKRILTTKPSVRTRGIPTEEEVAKFESDLIWVSQEAGELTDEEREIPLAALWYFEEDYYTSRETLIAALKKAAWGLSIMAIQATKNDFDVRETDEYKRWVAKLYDEGVEVL